ncbi:MAG: hypothetical protein U1D30_26140 [Planctomycetota bacterium]
MIAIITILGTLLLRAFTTAQGTARVAKESADIAQLAITLESFKVRFGIYPPSRIRLRENSFYLASDPFDQHSVQYLRRIWPNINLMVTNSATPPTVLEENCILWCKDDPSKQATAGSTAGNLKTTGKTYELEGDECLVFFLGGISEFDRNDPTRPILLHGFSRNPRNPGGVPNAADPQSVSREGPFHTFDFSRLFVRKGDAQVAPKIATANDDYRDFAEIGDRLENKLPSYRGQGAPDGAIAPIAYFSAYEGRGYRPNDCNLPEPLCADSTEKAWQRFQIMWPRVTIDGGVETPPAQPALNDGFHPYSLGPNPYTINRSYASNSRNVTRRHGAG